VLNKLDLLPPDEREARCREIIGGLGWTGPVFRISGISGEGTQELCQKIMARLEEIGVAAPLFADDELREQRVHGQDDRAED
jgi:GTP-binding protein